MSNNNFFQNEELKTLIKQYINIFGQTEDLITNLSNILLEYFDNVNAFDNSKEDIMLYVTENQDKLLGTILEIKCNGLSANSSGGNSVFYPTMKEFRTDKKMANSFDECLEIQNAALGLAI